MQSAEHQPNTFPADYSQGMTLREINEKLIELNLGPSLTEQQLDYAVAEIRDKAGEGRPNPRNTLVSGIWKSGGDTLARQYIEDLLSRARETHPVEPANHAQHHERNYPRPQPVNNDFDSGAQERSRPKDSPESFHIFGGKGALTVEADLTRGEAHTIAIDAAKSIGNRKYGWNDKIRLQLTVNELPEFAAVLFRYQSKCKFESHGQNNDKGIEIQWQDKSSPMFIKVFATGHMVPVPVTRPDIFKMQALVVRVLRKEYRGLDGTSLMRMLKLYGETS